MVIKRRVFGAILLLVLFVVVFANFQVFAETQNISDYLKKEYLTLEASFAITNDLDFAKINDEIKTNFGYDVEWSSTQPDVIRIDGDKGIVQRQKEDKDVRITANIVTNTETITKTFDFTVISKFRNVDISDNFYYPSDANTSVNDATIKADGWNLVTSGIDSFDSQITDAGELMFIRKLPNATDYTSSLRLTLDNKQEGMCFQTQMMLEPNLEVNTGSNRKLFILIYGITEDGASKKILELNVGCQNSYFSFQGSNGVADSVKEISRISGLDNKWFNLKVDVDLNDGIYNLWVDNERINDKVLYIDDAEDEIVGFDYVRMTPYRSATNYAVYLDEAAAIYDAQETLGFGTPVFLDENSEQVNEPKSGEITTQISVKNYSDEPRDTVMYTAVFNTLDNQLVCIKSDSKIIESGKTDTFQTSVQVGINERYRCFMMDRQLKPLCVPASEPSCVKNEFIYNDESKAGIKISWSEPYSISNDLSGYIVYRDLSPIANVDSPTTEWVDYEADFFSDHVYMVRSVTENGLLSDGVKTTFSKQTEVGLPAIHVTDAVTGRDYQYINFFGRNAIRDYYTTRNWSTDNTRFYFTDDLSRIFEYNIETEIVRYIDQRFYDAYTPARDLMTIGRNNNLYYVDNNKQVVRINLNSYEKEVIANLPEYVVWCTMISVTDDESKLAMTWAEVGTEAVKGRMPVLDIATGEWDTTFNHDFSVESPGTYAGNQVINPVYNDLLMYMKLGSTTQRLWLLNTETDEYKNLYTERLFDVDNCGEIMGHELWTCDGNEIIITKYNMEKEIGRPGIAGVDLNGRIRIINDEISPIHVATSPASTRWIVADENGGNGGKVGGYADISMADSITGQAYELVHVNWSGPHPGHPHPSFSYDGNYAWFGFDTGVEDYVIQIGWTDVSDITATSYDGGKISLSDSCETISYAGFKNNVTSCIQDGVNGYLLSNGNRMLINVKDEYAYGGATAENPDGGFDAEITITYWDSNDRFADPSTGEQRRGVFYVDYFAWNPDSEATLDKTTLYKENIPLNGTEKWVTKTIQVSGLNLENLELLESDLRIRPYRGDVIISNVEVNIKKGE